MIGLREDQQMKARMVAFLNHTTALWGSGLARESGVSVDTCITDPPHSRASPLPQGDEGERQAGGCVCCIEGRWLTSAYQAASCGLSARHCMSGWRKSR